MIIGGKEVIFLCGTRTWPGRGAGQASVFDHALVQLNELVDSEGTSQVLGAAKALLASERGFPTHGDTVTFVRFGSKTQSYDSESCKGLKILCTALIDVGAASGPPDRYYSVATMAVANGLEFRNPVLCVQCWPRNNYYHY